jgi:hypothetical protein
LYPTETLAYFAQMARRERSIDEGAWIIAILLAVE